MPRLTYIDILVAALAVGLLALFAVAVGLPTVQTFLPVIVIAVGLVAVVRAAGGPILSADSGLGLALRLTSRGRALVLGCLAIGLAVSVSGCAGNGLETAAAIRQAYCNGVSTGGRIALAQMATGQPVPVIRCDPEPEAKPSAEAAPVVVATPPAAEPAPAAPTEHPAPVAVLAEPVDPLI